jgi:hypothetical protein
MVSVRSSTRVAIAVIGLLTAITASSQAASEVTVVNTPSVTVASPTPHSRLVEFDALPISSGGTRTLMLGAVDAAGFTGATISLAVEVQGTVSESGVVTATMIPEVPLVIKALRDDGIKLFPIETGVHIPSSDRTDILGSQPMVFPLGFPTYALLLSNTSDRPVKASLYVYLTN